MSGTQGEIRQQIGEILATVRVLDRQQTDTANKVERAVDTMRTDMNALKHESRNAQQVVQGSLDIVKNEQVLMKQRLDAVEVGLKELKAPVEQWVSIRKRAVGFGLFAASFVAVLWAIVQPLWGPVVQRFFGLTK